MSTKENEQPMAKARAVALTRYNTAPNIRRNNGQFRVHLKSVGNPDFRQDPDRNLPGVPDIWAHVDTLAEASAICGLYRNYYRLGGGNWSGGEIERRADGLMIGRVAYNGRIFEWTERGQWSADTKVIFEPK